MRNGTGDNGLEFNGLKKGIAIQNFFMSLHSAVVSTTILSDFRMSLVVGFIKILFLGLLFVIPFVVFLLRVL